LQIKIGRLGGFIGPYRKKKKKKKKKRVGFNVRRLVWRRIAHDERDPGSRLKREEVELSIAFRQGKRSFHHPLQRGNVQKESKSSTPLLEKSLPG